MQHLHIDKQCLFTLALEKNCHKSKLTTVFPHQLHDSIAQDKIMQRIYW